MDCITVFCDLEKKVLRIEWIANPEADMWADAVMSIALQIESSPPAMRSKYG